MSDGWTTVTKRERRPPKKFDETYVVPTKPKKPAFTPLDAFIRDPKKKKPVYDLPSFIPVDLNGSSGASSGGGGGKGSSPGNGAASGPKGGKKSKPKSDAPAKKRVTSDKSFEPDVRSVKLSDLLNMFGESRVHFPESQSIWLKDMAAYLNHLVPYELSDPAFRNKDGMTDYPSSLLKPDVRTFFKDLLEDNTNPTLQLFQSHCIDTVIRNVGMGLPVTGYLIMLQILGQECPDVTQANMQRFIDARIVNKPRQSVSLTLCWMVLQSIQSCPLNGAKMWYDMLLPMTGSSNALNVKAYNEYAIHALEVMLDRFDKESECKIQAHVFGAMFDFLSTQRNLSDSAGNKSMTTRLAPLFTKLKTVAIRKTATESALICEIFHQFLNRLKNACQGGKNEIQIKGVQEVLVHCLSSCDETFNYWCTIDSENSIGSSLLLEHLSKSGRLHKFPNQIVRQTLNQLKENAKSCNNSAAAQILQSIEDLEKRMSKSRFPWKSILLLVITVTAVAISLDIQKHGSFRRSITGQNLQRYGIISAWNKTLAKVTTYSSIATTWISKNAPIVRAKIDPWISLATVKLAIGYNYVRELTAPAVEPIRVWIIRNIPPIIDHVKDKLIPLVISFMKDFTNAVLAVFVELGKWVQENVLTGSWSSDNLSKIAADSVSKIHSATGQAVSWITGQVKALTT